MFEHALSESDRLEKLSALYGIPVCMIMRINGFFDEPRFNAARTILIPDRQYCMRKYEKSKKLSLLSPYIDYTIREGDTIYEIARKHGTTMSIIARLNHLKDPEKLIAGQNLKLLKTPPGSIRYSVKPSDSLNGLSSRFRIPGKCLCAFNCIPENTELYAGMQLIIPQ